MSNIKLIITTQKVLKLVLVIYYTQLLFSPPLCCVNNYINRFHILKVKLYLIRFWNLTFHYRCSIQWLLQSDSFIQCITGTVQYKSSLTLTTVFSVDHHDKASPFELSTIHIETGTPRGINVLLWIVIFQCWTSNSFICQSYLLYRQSIQGKWLTVIYGTILTIYT